MSSGGMELWPGDLLLGISLRVLRVSSLEKSQPSISFISFEIMDGTLFKHWTLAAVLLLTVGSLVYSST
jgi:hypothetical protein